MQDTVLILEDSEERILRFRKVLADFQFPLRVCVWTSAITFIEEVQEYLPAAVAISLDHDLYPPRGSLLETGDGVDAAKYLAAHRPPCTIILHSSNADRVLTMRGILESEHLTVRTVLPFGTDWVERYWREEIAKLLEQQA